MGRASFMRCMSSVRPRWKSFGLNLSTCTWKRNRQPPQPTASPNMSKRIFGTDGVRGTANVEPVTAETALKLGRAAAYVFAQLNPRRTPAGARPKIVLGKDTRLSGYMLENALVAGITSLGVDVLVIGPLPTPGVAYITRSLRADAGI